MKKCIFCGNIAYVNTLCSKSRSNSHKTLDDLNNYREIAMQNGDIDLAENYRKLILKLQYRKKAISNYDYNTGVIEK